MRAQHSCFGFQAPPTDGLFFALFPDGKAASRLAKTADQLCIRHRLAGKPISAERFHVSLIGFGAYAGLPPDLVTRAKEAASAVRMPPFEVSFDRAISFLGSPRPLVLRGGDRLSGLIAFRRALGEAIREGGLARPKPQYVPHVTLLYDEHGIEEHAVEPIAWTAREFALVHSLRGRSRYIVMERWPLGTRLSLAG